MEKSRIELFIEELNSCILQNHESIKDIFNAKYGYPELDPIRDEICKCIICNLHQASITLTNHLLESSLKKCLIMNYSVANKQTDATIENAFKKGTEQFDKLKLDETISRACTQGLITKEQKKMLKKFKDDFRNPYSHAEATKIFKDTTVIGKSISLTKDEEPEKFLERIFDNSTDNQLNVIDILPVHGIIQIIIAKQISVPYFKKVDEIIREMLLKISKPNRKQTIND